MTERHLTAFHGTERIASGAEAVVARALRQAGAEGSIAVFDDVTGKPVDIDLSAAARPEDPPQARGRGRPKLGVTAREVTLLPRHWDWLNAQPGGASVTLRKLVEAARRSPETTARQKQAAAYAFMSAMAGNFPGFEEATRSLFAGDRPALEARIAPWPADVRDYALALAFGEPAPGED
jgi:hypothetical protein